MEPDNDLQSLIDELYREEVLEARRLTAEEKFRLGQELFEAACVFTRAGIRHQHPDASAERVEELLEERIALGERIQWHAALGAP